METSLSPRGGRPAARSLRGLALVVLVAALAAALVAQAERAIRRERRLLVELRAERARAQGLHRLAHLALDGDALSEAEKARLRDELREEAERSRLRAAGLRASPNIMRGKTR